jgi:hypothetical protein
MSAPQPIYPVHHGVGPRLRAAEKRIVEMEKALRDTLPFLDPVWIPSDVIAAVRAALEEPHA